MGKVSLIAAVDSRGAIGYRGGLLFRLPDDMKRFRLLTTGHTVLMGRRTFESLPHGALPHRRNIVVSRSLTPCPGAEVYGSIDEALRACHDDEVYVIGGGSVYAQTLALADELCLTEVDATAPDADTFFPTVSDSDWTLIGEEHHPIDERHAYPFRFTTYVRR